MADKDYFKSIAENYCSETDDPDLQLSYYPMNAELARKLNARYPQVRAVPTISSHSTHPTSETAYHVR